MLRSPSLFPCPVPPTAGAAGLSAAVATPRRRRAVAINLILFVGLAAFLAALAPTFAAPASAAPAERRFVTDQEAARWAGVGLLSRADGVSCTAVLIRPDVALTAAHCVADADARTVVEARDLTFGAGVRDGRAVEIAPARSVEVHPGYFVAADRYDERRVRVDIARVALASPIRSAPAYRVAGTPPAGDDVALLSYARGRVGRVSIQHPCRILGRETEFLLLDCFSESGASGSPYFVIGRDGEPTVVGINSGRRMRGDRVYALALAFAHVRDFIGPSGGPPVAAADRAPETGANAPRTTGVRSRPQTQAGGAPRLPGGVKAGAGLKGLNR